MKANPETPPDADRERPLRTAFWDTNETFDLTWPPDWSVSVHWPKTPPPLSSAQIAEALSAPAGIAPIGELSRGKEKPLIIIDDLSRATPTSLILEPLLDELRGAGIPPDRVTILLATGTHPPPSEDLIARKVGPSVARACRVVVHRDSTNCTMVGRTRFGTPIVVDQEVLDADWLIGIGGVYPNNTAGFGGGSKLALGVLSRQSISHLHGKHRAAGWGQDNESHQFRRDLDEIAERIGLIGMISVHVDAEARPVRVVYGDHRVVYRAEAQWAARTYAVEAPGDADVVVSNAYPNDATLVSARHKAFAPLMAARSDASRIVIASCHAGPGGHGLFPLVDTSTLAQRLRRKASVTSPSQFATAVVGGIRRRLVRREAPRFAWPIVVYRPGNGAKPELPRVGGLEYAPSWQSVIGMVQERHSVGSHIRVVVYPCAPLQVLRDSSPTSASMPTNSGQSNR